MTAPAYGDVSWLEVNEVPLSTPGWLCTDYSELLDSPPFRGSNEVMPGAARRRAFVKIADEQQVTLPLTIFGEFDIDGVTQSDPVQGVIDNVAYLQSNLGILLPTNGGVVEAVWFLPDGGTRAADVQVLGMFGTRDVAPGVVRTTLDLILVSGWTEGAS